MTNETFKKLTTGCFYDRLFAFMDECQINNINVAYSGGGDSGSVDHIALMFSNKNKMSLDDRSKLNDDVADVFEEELAQPIWDKHGSFADGGGYSVDGHVIYNAKDKTVTISGTDHYWGDSDDEEDEETRDETWEDFVYSKNDEDDYEDYDYEDYDFALLYHSHVSKSPLPEEFHNRMLIAASDGNQSAKKYILGLKKGK
jgi:hypothetical protein